MGDSGVLAPSRVGVMGAFGLAEADSVALEGVRGGLPKLERLRAMPEDG